MLAYASDAGMPGISDPGQVLVEAARAVGVAVEVVPGPVACATALVASGIPCDHFFFEGFLPRRAGERERRLRQLAAVPGALIFYESPYRIAATLETVAAVFPTREAALCRELTKLHEEVLRLPAPELFADVAARDQVKGEIVLVVAPPAADELEALAAGAPAAAARGHRARPWMPTPPYAATSRTPLLPASPLPPSRSASPSATPVAAARSTPSSSRRRTPEVARLAK